jgi:Protein of unknown function (DUF429)
VSGRTIDSRPRRSPPVGEAAALGERPQSPFALSWSSGKDSALVLWTLRRRLVEPEALITTVTEPYERISMHGVRRELLAPVELGMRHRIVEIAHLAAADERVFEVHPEVSFRELLGRTPSPKRTGSGASERRLAPADAGIDLPDLPHPLDDVLDAAVAAWSAMRYARGKALPLPHGYQARVGAIWR